MGEWLPVDIIVFGILAIAGLRGLFLGLIREAFSIAALAMAVVAVRLFHEPVGERLAQLSEGAISETMAPWIAGVLLAVFSIAGLALLGRFVRKGARAVGLGWADRAGGAALGLAEGALAACVLLIVGTTLLGRDHTVLAGSRSLQALERLEGVTAETGLADSGRALQDVAAPPKRR